MCIQPDRRADEVYISSFEDILWKLLMLLALKPYWLKYGHLGMREAGKCSLYSGEPCSLLKIMGAMTEEEGNRCWGQAVVAIRPKSRQP